MTTLATHKITILWLVSVAEQTGPSLTWSETPEDIFSSRGPIYGPREKNCIGVSDKVSIKPACSATETS